jgi:hypothetical protein
MMWLGVAVLIGVVKRHSLGSLSLADLWDIGFGALDPSQIFSDVADGPRIRKVVVANLPQLMVSLLYFNYNGAITCMILAVEWAGFSKSPRGLRVSDPSGPHQRSTYFLQLPYRYSIPMMVSMTTLHWIISQSLFAFEINIYDMNGNQADRGPVSACGYSIIATIFALILGGLMIISLLACALWKLPNNLPLVSNCSTAISAACHSDPHTQLESGLEEELLMWGASTESSSDCGVGHATFRARSASPLVTGGMYS